MTELSGGCLCGAVRYTVTGGIDKSGICHCRQCQKWTGGPFFAAFEVKASDIVWSGSPVEWRSSGIAVRAHCPTCGTPLYWRGDANRDRFDIATATLDDPEAMPPTYHIWISSALTWPRIADDLPRHLQERPGDQAP
ncbi:MAG: GFA family protein [Pseudomonadota bacterium]|nr:GFA family protein [Pseudomonadota bacterium]